MNIVHVFPHLGNGGDWKYVRQLARWQADQGHQVTVAASNALPERFANEPFETLLLSSASGWRGFFGSCRIARHAGRSVDLWHAHTPKSALVAEAARWNRRAKCVLTWHLLPEMTARQRHLRRWLCRRVDRVVAVSSELNSLLQTDYGFRAHQVSTIPCGIEPAGFFPSSNEQRQQARLELGLTPKEIVLGFLGRFDVEKDLSLLVRGLARVKDDFPNVRVILAGAGPCRDEVTREAEECNVNGMMKWVGYVDDPRAFISQCDILVLPSRSHETFGLVVVEAFLCEVPVLRSDTPGSQDQIIPGETGEVFQRRNVEDFERQLRKMMAYRDRWPRMGKNARQLALEKFTAEQSFQKYQALYNELLGT